MESEKGQLEAANFNEQHLTSYPLQLLVLAFGKSIRCFSRSGLPVSNLLPAILLSAGLRFERATCIWFLQNCPDLGVATVSRIESMLLCAQKSNQP
jgi:hypothetical protein